MGVYEAGDYKGVVRAAAPLYTAYPASQYK